MVEITDLNRNNWFLERGWRENRDGEEKEKWGFKHNIEKGYPPTFKELADWLSVIGVLEDIKYPHGKGRELVREYVNEALDKKWPFPNLLKKYGLDIS